VPTLCAVDRGPTQGRVRSRDAIGVVVRAASKAVAEGGSLRKAASDLQIPSSSFAAAWTRSRALDGDAATRAFFHSPEGILLLHGLVLALLLVLVFQEGLGVEKVRRVLVLARLDRRVACSASHLRGRVVAMTGMMATFDAEQKATLAPHMPHRMVYLGPDEMFRCGRMILTAPDLVTGMLLVHRIDTHRDGLTWSDAIQQGTHGLSMTLGGLCGDRAGGIQRAAEQSLHVAYMPELFHVQKGLRDTLGRRTRARLAAAEKARTKATTRALNARLGHGADGTILDPAVLPAQQVEAALALDVADHAVRDAVEDHTVVGDVTRTLARALHPVDLHTGALCDPAQVEGIVRAQLARLDPLADRLGSGCVGAVRSARDVIPAWKDAVTQWFVRVIARVNQEGLSVDLAGVLLTVLIPACYLARVSARNHLAAVERAYLRDRSQTMLRQVAEHPEWRDLPRDLRVHLEQVAQECVVWFVRSSSPTEGHNAWTSRRLHRHHDVRDAWLGALRVVHNFLLRRPDGTTAAQRLYGQPHGDLVQYLCARMPLPPMPRNRPPKIRPDPLGLTERPLLV